MTNPTRWHVIRPPRIVYVVPSLLYGELFVALLGVALAQGNFLGGFGALAITHPLAIWLTMREPHMDTIIKERVRRFIALAGMPRQPGYPVVSTRNTWIKKGKSLVP